VRVAFDVSAVPDRPAGAGRYAVEVVRAVARRDDVDLLLVARRGDDERWPEGAEVLPVVPNPRPARLLWEQLQGPRLARRADLWHGPHYTMPLRSTRPSVVTIHDLTFFDHPELHERAKVRWFRRMIRSAVRRADVLVCVSDQTRRRLEDLLAPSQPVVVAPHAVDHERFRPDGPFADLPRPYVAFVGTVEPRKEVATLARAVASLDRPDLSLVVAGRPGWGDAEAAAAEAAAPLGDRYVRLGYVDDDEVPAILRGAAAVAYPARQEGFGIPALEALACGAPLVTTTGTPMEEVVGDAALLVPPGDAGALAAALARILDDPAEATRLRDLGPAVAAAHTWEASAERHVEAWTLALARGSRSVSG
jgi:glycosyltransferase involved in cell wall biosynthesis